MTGIVEACFIGAQGTTVVDGSQSATGKGEADVENLFAALLLALSCGLVAPDGQLEGGATTQSPEGDIVAGGVEGGGNTSALPGQVMAVSAEPIGAEGHLPVSEGPAASAANETGGLPPAEAALPDAAATMQQASAVNEAGEQMPAQAFPNASEAAPVASATNEAATDGLAFPQPEPLQIANAADPNVLTAVHDLEAPAESELPVRVSSGSPQLDMPAESAFSAKLVASPQPQQSETPVVAPLEVEQPSAVPEGSPVPATRAAAPADPRTLAFAQEGGEPQAEILPVESTDANETGSAPSGLAHRPARGEPALIGAQNETQQDGNDSARGQGERMFPGNLVRPHQTSAPRISNGFDNSLSRASDVSESQLAQSVVNQTVRSVLLSVRGGSSELRVRLKPEHLGELHLRVVFKDNVLHLDVSTQSTVVKSLIESNLGQLRQSLDNSGLDTGRLSVTVDPDLSSGEHSGRQAHAFQPSQNDWGETYHGRHADEELPSDAVSTIARMRYAVAQLDLIA